MAKSEIDAGADRLARKFAKTAGVFLGVVDRKTDTVKKPELFNSFVEQFNGLLKRGFSESECDQVIYQAFKEKKKEPVPSRLFLGRTPIEQKKNPDRNLIAEIDPENQRYHPALGKRMMPRVKLTVTEEGIKQEKIRGGERNTYRQRFTLGDLKVYWESHATTCPLAQSGDEAINAFNYLLETHSVADILWSIDALFLSIGDRPTAGQRPIRIFDLKPYLEEEQANRKEIQGCL